MKRYSKNRDYTREEVEEDREYGLYVYSGIWNMIRPVLILLCSLLLAGGILMSGYNHLYRHYFAPVDSSDDAEIAFTVTQGSSLTKVSKELESAGLISSSTVFKYYADFLGYSQKIQSGEYRLRKNMSVAEIADQLASGDGRPIVRNITVIPGWTVADIADYLVKENALDSAGEFLSLCKTGSEFSAFYYVKDVLDNKNTARIYNLEGYLMPDTYEVYVTATPSDIIKKLLSQTEAVYPQEYHDRADELGLTMDQVLTIASIIEKEAKTQDFAKVSAVFHNRLKLNMSLGSDATVKYVTGSKKMNLNAEDLKANSPYNTYLVKGLPPGPICSPSRDAIRAALYPDQQFIQDQYLYFCSKDPATGELHFSRTLAEHEAAVQIYAPLWQAFDRERGLE